MVQVPPGVNRTWRACKGNICIPGRSGRFRGRFFGKFDQSLVNGENLTTCQKSDCLIVARKPVKAGGVKGGAAGNCSLKGNRRGTGGQGGWNRKQRE